MSKILVITSLGYYKDQQGRVIAKAQLPPGSHDLADGLVYVEVNSQAELDSIEIYQDPADLLLQQQEKKITERTRKIAVDQLITDGQLPPGYL